MAEKRKDNKGRNLQKGESQRKDGRYYFQYKDSLGKAKVVYSWDLAELREKEKQIKKDLAAYIAVNEEHVDCAIDYLMIAKYLERLGDHAVNICEWVQFYKTGMHKSERIL